MTKFYKGQPVRFTTKIFGNDSSKYIGKKTEVTAVCPAHYAYPYEVRDAIFGANDIPIFADEIEPIYTPVADLKVGDRVMLLEFTSYLAARPLGGVCGTVVVTDLPHSVAVAVDQACDGVTWPGYGHENCKWVSRSTKLVKLEGSEVKREENICLGVSPSIAGDLALKPQTRKVLAHLNAGNHITHLEAQAVYGVWSLSSRVSELKRAGYKIKRTLKNDAMGKRYAAYELA